MSRIEARPYRGIDDFHRIGEFLLQTHRQYGQRGNWLQPRWEHMHYHPLLEPSLLPRIGVWEDDGEIVGVAHFEHVPGEVFFELHPSCAQLKPALVEWSLEHLRADPSEEAGRPPMWCYVHEDDDELAREVVSVAADGTYASYCGMWFDRVNRLAYVEPVCTDPDFRRLGLGRACVLEGVRRCALLGADRAIVGSTMGFYRSMGFEQTDLWRVWVLEA